MSTKLELQLIDASAPDGEIPLADLAEIARTLQELSLRIGRQYADAEGPGRTHRAIEELSQLRLTGVTTGSTRLLVSRGQFGALDVEFPDVAELDSRFWAVVDGIGHDRRPSWVSDLIADSAADFLASLQGAAPRVVVSMGGDRRVEISTGAVHLTTWSRAEVAVGDELAVVGKLEKVDLHSHSFRIRDDVGNTIELKAVPNDHEAATLINRYVIVRGTAIHGRTGQLSGLTVTTIDLDDDPIRSAQIPSAVPIARILASAPGPDPEGGIELTDDEFAAFLAAARS